MPLYDLYLDIWNSCHPFHIQYSTIFVTMNFRATLFFPCPNSVVLKGVGPQQNEAADLFCGIMCGLFHALFKQRTFWRRVMCMFSML